MTQSVELKFWPYKNEMQLLKKLEEIGRTAYLSHDKAINDATTIQFIDMIIRNKHLGILEHEIITFKIITNRAIANELVRHRHASYVQESSRYVNYTKKSPAFITDKEMDTVDKKNAERMFENYRRLIDGGMTPEHARDFLPLGLKTTIYATMNLRSWFHFLEMRNTLAAHPMMRHLAQKILHQFEFIIPDITVRMMKIDK